MANTRLKILLVIFCIPCLACLLLDAWPITLGTAGSLDTGACGAGGLQQGSKARGFAKQSKAKASPAG